MELNCIEEYLADSLRKMDRILTAARVANLTKGWKGRGPCQYRNLCARGCPYGGYFSSYSATLPSSFSTGILSLRPFSVFIVLLFFFFLQLFSFFLFFFSLSFLFFLFYSPLFFFIVFSFFSSFFFFSSF